METPVEPAPESPTSSTVPDRQELKREVLDFVKLVVWFLIIFLGLRAYVIEGYEVQGESMEPTLQNNERILVLKLPHELSKFRLFSGINAVDAGDIIVFDSPDATDKRYVKRVIAKGSRASNSGKVGAQSEGQRDGRDQVLVEYDNEGKVYVNSRVIDEDYLAPGASGGDRSQKLNLDPGEYYVLGDNRDVSKDSRSFDAIADGAIIGKAVLRFWPPSKISIIR